VLIDGGQMDGSHINIRSEKIIHAHLIDPQINLNSDVVRIFPETSLYRHFFHLFFSSFDFSVR
jgi:hypothetical protein